MYETDVSRGIATLKNESDYFFENSKVLESLRELFFAGKHLTKFNFDIISSDSINEEVESFSVQAWEETHWCNDPQVCKK